MAKELKINLIVNDDGTVVIKNFADQAAANLKKVEDAGRSMKTGFADTWQGMATGPADTAAWVLRGAYAACARSQATMSAVTSSRLVSFRISWRPPRYSFTVTSARPASW